MEKKRKTFGIILFLCIVIGLACGVIALKRLNSPGLAFLLFLIGFYAGVWLENSQNKDID